MKRVILESPYAGDIEINLQYGRACLRDSIMRGEAPIASHLLLTQPGVLNDNNPVERNTGIFAGLKWCEVSDGSVVYVDLGISKGMRYGIDRAVGAGKPVEYRSLKFVGKNLEPIVCAGDLPTCECCDEPWCPVHNMHYDHCPCVGPSNAEDEGLQVVEINGSLYGVPMLKD